MFSILQKEAAPAQPDAAIDSEILLDLSRDVLFAADETGAIVKYNKQFGDIAGPQQDGHFMTLFAETDRPHIRTAIQELALEPAASFTATLAGHAMSWQARQEGDLLYLAGRPAAPSNPEQDRLNEAESLANMGHWRWVLGEDSIEWSDQIYTIFGVEKGKFAPSLDSMTARIHPDDIDRVNQALQRAIIEEKDYDAEFRIKTPGHPNGERHIRSEGRCERNTEGEVTALFGIMQDRTERVLHEADLRTAKNAAERAYNAKSQFLANMSHELRTPLNAIIGFSEMIERQLLGPIGSEKYLDYIKGIRESGEHLLDLISDILDMSKIEAGKYELMLEEMNVMKIIKLAVHMMEGRAMEADVKLRVESSVDDETKITADRRAVLQILLNLLSNATKFSKQDGEITISCTADDAPDNRAVHITIADHGIGIPANKLASITTPFEQVAPSYTREHDGSGLGLAITKDLAELHGGSLSIESTVDVGTSVTITLPFEAEALAKG